MKFVTPFITLLAVYSVNSFEILKRDVTGLDVTEECQKEIESTKEYECIVSSVAKKSDNEIKSGCERFQSDDCKKFYENPLNYFPICQKETTFAFLKGKMAMEFLKKNFELVCSTDEKNKRCPAAVAVGNSISINEDHIKKTCTSKKCTDALNDMLDVMINNKEQLIEEGMSSTGNFAVFTLLKAELNSQECTKAQTSDAISNRSRIGITLTFVFSIIFAILI